MDFYSPEERAKFLDLLLNHSKVNGLEMRFRTLSQELITKMYANFITLDKSKYILTTFEDITKRKEAEEALQVSEQRNKLALAGADLGTWDWNVATGEVVLDERWAEILGYRLNELEPHVSTWENLIHPDDFQHVRSTLNDHLEGKSDYYETEHRVRHKDGHWVWILDKGRVIARGRDGAPVRVCGAHLDITSRKEAEIAVRANESKYRQLFEAITDGVFVLDRDWRYVEVNKVASQMVGKEKHELLGRKIFDFFPGVENTAFFKAYMNTISSGLPNSIINEFQHPDGRKGYYEVNVYPNLIGILCVAKDITERKRTEEALRASEELFRGIFTTSPIGIVLVNTVTQRFIQANKSFLKIIEYSADELKGLSVDDITVADDWEMEKDLINDFINERLDRYEVVKRYISKSGEIKYVQINGDLLHRNEEPPIALANVIDITERLQKEQEREELKTQLQQAQKMEAVGALAGGIAHEFNNLLQAISGHTQLLLMETDPTDPIYLNLDAIQKSGTRAAELVRQLLQFSRKANDERRPIHFNDIFKQAQQMLERNIPKMIQIQVLTGGRIRAVNADPIQIKHILLELSSNAADAMPKGGKLFFEVQNATLDDKYAKRRLGAQPGQYVVLTVSDTGRGMDQETINQIFDPFFTTKEFGKGTGLGLASVYGIVKNHGGYITCRSEVGQGTTFKIYFPAIKEPEHVQPESTPHGKETILLVDDKDAIRGFAKQALIRFGYSVLAASTIEEALELYSAKSDEIGLVFIDPGMPGMGLRKCFEKLLQINPVVKVVIVSDDPVNELVKIPLDSGAVGYLNKPYQLSDLLNAVRAILHEEQ